MTMTQAQLVEALEALVDANGLYSVTQCLHLVCLEKAEHLQINWQDSVAAKRWERAAKAFYNAHAKLEQIQIEA